jgi:hypothetical protein
MFSIYIGDWFGLFKLFIAGQYDLCFIENHLSFRDKNGEKVLFQLLVIDVFERGSSIFWWYDWLT